MRLSEFVGNEKLKGFVRKLIQKAGKGTPFPNLLFVASPGMGKTTFVRCLGLELGRVVWETSGQSQKVASDWLPFINKSKHGDILFVDEIHRLTVPATEGLMTMTENAELFWKDKNGPQHRKFHEMIYLAATTDVRLMTDALKTRFLEIALEPYTLPDLEKIAAFHLAELGLRAENKKVLERLVGNSRFIPRCIRHYVEAASYYAEDGIVSIASLDEMFQSLSVAPFGLSQVDIKIMHLLKDNGVVGAENLAQLAGVDPSELQQVYEPYLAHVGFVARGSRGRELTEKGRKYLVLYDRNRQV